MADLDISLPSPEDLAWLATERQFALSYADDEVSAVELLEPRGKVALVDALLASGLFGAYHTRLLRAFGVLLGDAFVQELALEWVVVTDGTGRTLAVHQRDSTIVLYPLSLLTKRIVAGETVEVQELFDRMVADVGLLRALG